MNYPNGAKFKEKETVKKNQKTRCFSSANRGMNLESAINSANEYYKSKEICLISKRPTPINVVKVDYSKGARITDAYFEKQSTTDYNGVYKGRYIDFEAKNTKNKTSFPLNNIYLHQINHLEGVIHHGGIAFFIIEFEAFNEIYLLDAKYVIDYYKNGERKSIPYEVIKNVGREIQQAYNPRLDYIKEVDFLYFK